MPCSKVHGVALRIADRQTLRSVKSYTSTCHAHFWFFFLQTSLFSVCSFCGLTKDASMCARFSAAPKMHHHLSQSPNVHLDLVRRSAAAASHCCSCSDLLFWVWKQCSCMRSLLIQGILSLSHVHSPPKIAGFYHERSLCAVLSSSACSVTVLEGWCKTQK